MGRGLWVVKYNVLEIFGNLVLINLGEVMRIFLILLSLVFVVSCTSNKNELAGIRIGSDINKVKNIGSYQLQEAFYKNENSCITLGIYHKEELIDKEVYGLIMISVIDGVVHGVTEEYNLYGRGVADPLRIDARQQEINKLYGDPVFFKEIQVTPEYKIHIFDYSPVGEISSIRFSPQYYSDSEGYTFSLHDRSYMKIESMEKVDKCN